MRRIAVRATGAQPDICEGCYRGRHAVCGNCGRRRPCAFVIEGRPTCQACRPRVLAACAHCGQPRPPTVRWPEGPVCDPCYTATLRRRGPCRTCRAVRRLVAPPGPAATTCADCAELPTAHLRGHVCGDCGIEDKLYERSRCAPCALQRRTAELLMAGAEQRPAELTGVYQAITTTDTPRSALNWLRNGASAALLAELAAGDLAATHDALDAHPHRRAAHYLRQLLVANHVLPARDEALASTERFLADLLAGIDRDPDRRLLAAYGTWRVLRRLRRTAERAAQPRTYTRHARLQIATAARFLDWLAGRRTPLGEATQADIDDWLTSSGPSGHAIRDFLGWAHEHQHCPRFVVSAPGRRTGPAITDEQRWTLLARLLHDDALELTDRVAGCLLLLYGQQLSRITALTSQQVRRQGAQVFLRLGHDEITVPEHAYLVRSCG